MLFTPAATVIIIKACKWHSPNESVLRNSHPQPLLPLLLLLLHHHHGNWLPHSLPPWIPWKHKRLLVCSLVPPPVLSVVVLDCLEKSKQEASLTGCNALVCVLPQWVLIVSFPSPPPSRSRLVVFSCRTSVFPPVYRAGLSRVGLLSSVVSSWVSLYLSWLAAFVPVAKPYFLSSWPWPSPDPGVPSPEGVHTPSASLPFSLTFF